MTMTLKEETLPHNEKCQVLLHIVIIIRTNRGVFLVAGDYLVSIIFVDNIYRYGQEENYATER